MTPQPPGHRLPGYRAERLFESITRFRRGWARYHRPEDAAYLLRLFPRVTLRSGYILDYLILGSADSSWIWPYARRADAGADPGPPPALKALGRERLAAGRGTGELRKAEVETLYSYLIYESSPEGMFEYALFVTELWALKSPSKSEEWLELSPVLSRRRFDELARRSSAPLHRIPAAETFDPLVVRGPERGGEVQFPVFQGGTRRRVINLRLRIDPDGLVFRESGELIARLE